MLQVKFLMSILKWQVYSSPNFASLFSVTKDTRLYFSTSNNIYLPQRRPLKWRFETFECLGQSLTNSSCEFWNGKSFPLQILRYFSVSWKITPLYFSSSNNIYFAQKEPMKVNIFETFLSAQIKICQTPYVNFEMTSRFLSKFCFPLQFHEG